MVFLAVPLLLALSAAPDTQATTQSGPATSLNAPVKRSYCAPLLDDANALIKVTQDNDARLAEIMTLMNTAKFNAMPYPQKERLVNHFFTLGGEMATASGKANDKIRQLKELAAAPATDADKRAAIGDLAKALQATLDRQYRIGHDTITAMVVYQGRDAHLQGFASMNSLVKSGGNASITGASRFPNGSAVAFNPASSSDLSQTGNDDNSFTNLPNIFPDWKDNMILNQNADFETTMHQIADEFAGRVELVNAFEGLAAQFGDRAAQSCVEEELPALPQAR